MASREKIPQDVAVTRNIPQDMEGGEEAAVRRVIEAVSGGGLGGVAADELVSVAPNLGRREGWGSGLDFAHSPIIREP